MLQRSVSGVCLLCSSQFSLNNGKVAYADSVAFFLLLFFKQSHVLLRVLCQMPASQSLCVELIRGPCDHTKDMGST